MSFFIKIVLFTVLILTHTTSKAEFLISAEPLGLGKGVYAYHFLTYAAFPDFTVKVSSHAIMPDLKMKLVSSSQGEDLTLSDKTSVADPARLQAKLTPWYCDYQGFDL